MTRLRARLAAWQRAMAPPPLRILESVLGLLDQSGLAALCELGVPDVLDRRMTIPELASTTGADPEALERLLRYGAARGWVRLHRGTVMPTSITRFLATSHPGGWRAWVEFTSIAEVHAAAGSLAQAVRVGGDAFSLAAGTPFFDWLATHPTHAATFDAAMAAGGRMHALALAKALDWSDDHTVCDVGGGNGALLRVLVERHPHLNGVILDLPHVIDRVDDTGTDIEAIAGDAFEEVPAGASTYLLVNVIHDWSDDDAIRLLGRVGAAASAGARIVVVEGVRHQRAVDDVAQRSDLLMLALAPGGQERTVEEVAALGEAAALRRERVVQLSTADLAHVFRPLQ